jgi:hypothetical protein
VLEHALDEVVGEKVEHGGAGGNDGRKGYQLVLDVTLVLQARRLIAVECTVFARETAWQMSGCGPPAARPDALDPEGWAHSEEGEIAEGKPQSRGGNASFRHSRELQAEDVLRMKVLAGRGAMVGIAAEGFTIVGFAAESYDVEKHMETRKSIAQMSLSKGMTVIHRETGMMGIHSDISRDGEDHGHNWHLKGYIPKTLPYDLALRITKDGNVPQIQFNDDAVWHDFAPDRAALKAGPWSPYLALCGADARLSDHCVHRPKPTKSAGKTSKAPAVAPSAAAAADGAGAAVTEDDESAPPLHKQALQDEGVGS